MKHMLMFCQKHQHAFLKVCTQCVLEEQQKKEKEAQAKCCAGLRRDEIIRQNPRCA